jgi:dUTP pyrophosphatase
MSAGMDLYAAVENDICIYAGTQMIPTGIRIAIPSDHEAQVRPRSGLAAKHGVTVLNTPGTIDADYRGEIKVILINHGQKAFIVTRGLRIAQMVVAKYERLTITEVTISMTPYVGREVLNCFLKSAAGVSVKRRTKTHKDTDNLSR